MRFRIIASAIFLLAVMALFNAQVRAQVVPPSTPDQPPRRELALTYSWARSNAPPGGCGCFNLNGGSVQLAWPLNKKRLALAGDFSVIDQPNAVSVGNSLTLETFLAGVQYRPMNANGRLQPFVEVLAGGSHASGKLITSSPAATNSAINFAGKAGGGLDVHLSNRWWWRAVQADYLATTFNNGSNNHQNILRIDTGVALRF